MNGNKSRHFLCVENHVSYTDIIANNYRLQVKLLLCLYSNYFGDGIG